MLGPANSGSLVASSEEQQRILDKNNNKNEKPFEGSFGSPQCFPAFANFLLFSVSQLQIACARSFCVRDGVRVRGWEA
jgi:hypothetical protein